MTTQVVRVGLVVGEFFDNTLENHSLLGGYGMLARNYIAEYLPCRDISIETILGFNKINKLKTITRDNRKLIHLLPNIYEGLKLGFLYKILNRFIIVFRRRKLTCFLDGFDVFMTIETSNSEILKLLKKKLILNIQDPRPQEDWDEIDTVPTADNGSPRPSPHLTNLYQVFIMQERLIGISQGEYLISKAKRLYNLPKDFPVEVVKNPALPVNSNRKWENRADSVVWLGRLDSVKRPWLALEVAKRMPETTFYFLGKIQQPVVSLIDYQYKDLQNIKFVGHIDGAEKNKILSHSKVLINTSIHEATPVSFLEALSHGMLIVSCQNPDSISEKYGFYTGKIIGDGRDKADIFVERIRQIFEDSNKYARLSDAATEYAMKEHSLDIWTDRMRSIIRAAVM